MTYYHWILVAGFFVFFITALILFFTVILKKETSNPSRAKGNINAAIAYSFIGAMLPGKKESAYLHLPTYTAGMIFHIGTFLSFFWLIIIFFEVPVYEIVFYLSAAFIFISSFCGISIFIKRIIKNEMRQLSNLDDYLCNILVTTFQIITAFTLFFQYSYLLLFVYSAILFVYMPIGKIRHCIYFFTSRIHLGKYFGHRGVWPPK